MAEQWQAIPVPTTTLRDKCDQQRRPPTLQLTDDAVVAAQRRSKWVQQVVKTGDYRGMAVDIRHDLVSIQTSAGRRVLLPPELWSVAFKVHHDSVWAGHLRAPHTYERIARHYWWPDLRREVARWVRGCQECGSRKAKPREVIPPLRSIRGGDVGDRWALDVAGPLPVAGGGERYVIAAVEYVTRYAVAKAVERHTADNVAKFLMEEIVLKFGVFRELLTDGAPELTGLVVEKLVMLLQAQQVNPVPYRPQMLGLVERFHRTWKDCVSTYMQAEAQNDWADWVPFAVYAYNSGRHSTVALSPNELMMGRKLRNPNELLQQANVTEAGELSEYNRWLMRTLRQSHEVANQARVREQQRQARYYDRKVRKRRNFVPGDRVWMYRPPKGPKATKLAHQWIGPMRIVEPAGYENFLIEREDQNGEAERFIAHVSFLISYHYPVDLLQRVAADIEEQLEHEGQAEQGEDVEAADAVAGATSSAVPAATRIATGKRKGRAKNSVAKWRISSEQLVEVRRRRRRNKAGYYVLEYALRPARSGQAVPDDDENMWVSSAEYDELFAAGRVVEDPLLE